MRRMPILLWHDQRGLYLTPNYWLHLSHHSLHQQVMLPPEINQRSGRSKNNSTTCRIATNTDTKRIRSKKSNQALTNNHIWNQQSRIHLWATATYSTNQGHHKDSRAPQHHPKDTLTSYHGQTPPPGVTIHGFLFVNGRPFLHKN